MNFDDDMEIVGTGSPKHTAKIELEHLGIDLQRAKQALTTRNSEEKQRLLKESLIGIAAIKHILKMS